MTASRVSAIVDRLQGFEFLSALKRRNEVGRAFEDERRFFRDAGFADEDATLAAAALVMAALSRVHGAQNLTTDLLAALGFATAGD